MTRVTSRTIWNRSALAVHLLVGGMCVACRNEGEAFIRSPTKLCQRQQFPNWVPIRLTRAQDAPILSACLWSGVRWGPRDISRFPADSNVGEPRSKELRTDLQP